MKKIYLILVFSIFMLSHLDAQKRIQFGLTGGMFYGNADVSLDGADISTVLSVFGFDEDALEVLDGGGFYLGLLADIKIISDLNIQPEVLYANGAGESVLIVPLMLKYYIADSFNVQLGPQFDVVFDIPDDIEDFVDSAGYSLGFGGGYDINDRFALEARYNIGLNNRVDEAITESLPTLDPSLRTNMLQLGVSYKFN